MKLQSPGIDVFAAEARALSAALSCVEERGNRQLASDLVRQVFHRMSADSLEDWFVKVAMGRIIGESFASPAPVKIVASPDWQLFEIVARSWVSWAHGEAVVAQELLDRSAELRFKPSVHVTALEFWRSAVEALVARDSSARRLFRRAAEFGAQYGLDSNPPVQWSYAASFFHVPLTSS